MARGKVADPNAPFMTHPARPQLSKREAVLDPNGVPECSPSQLSLFESRAQSSGVHHTVQFSIANAGEACRVSGFPSVALLRADGSVLGNVHLMRVTAESMAATLGPGKGSIQDSGLDEPSPEVLLPTRGMAEFQLGWITGPACDQVSRIVLAAPGSTRSVVIQRQLVVCENRVLVTAVAPSNADRP